MVKRIQSSFILEEKNDNTANSTLILANKKLDDLGGLDNFKPG